MLRSAVPLSLSLAALASLSCGEETATAPPPCDLPEGCVRVERVDGTCQCLEWQLVSIKPVPVKYVVVGVVYSALGNQSLVSEGHWPAEAGRPETASDFGSRWRSLVRAFDGSERVAALGPIDVAGGFWGPVVPITATSAAMAQPPSMAMYHHSAVDVPPRWDHEIFIWLNPAVAVAADHAGGRSVAWSSTGCSGLSACPADVFIALTGWLDGTVANSNPYIQAVLDTFDAADRAAILRYDPFYDPGWDPSAIGGDPRFELLANVRIDSAAPPIVQPATWVPCAGTLGDDDFPVLARSAEVPYGSGETFLLQHSVLSTAASCAPQRPGLVLGTSTPDCSIQADVFVDRAFGTLLMIPSSVSAACTTP